jgi:hypothetical protein
LWNPFSQKRFFVFVTLLVLSRFRTCDLKTLCGKNRLENTKSGIVIVMSTVENERRRTKDVRVFTTPEKGSIVGRDSPIEITFSKTGLSTRWLIRLYKSLPGIQSPTFLNRSFSGQLPRLALNLRLDFAMVFACEPYKIHHCGKSADFGPGRLTSSRWH